MSVDDILHNLKLNRQEIDCIQIVDAIKVIFVRLRMEIKGRSFC